ncbi:hypothetical protein FOMPIDRAFT_95085 [Fomitopsis schrenkii]|uniref:Uncharacterized protein n=1 Tax=Fomitopsis schrenkii TaxID=2126942 RepID=S8E8L9_FOMSC|nr:hypothetical protein FOMPIDRAFT_95085 [Fomitopsis schrenkii]
MNVVASSDLPTVFSSSPTDDGPVFSSPKSLPQESSTGDDNNVQQLVRRIKHWLLRQAVFGHLLDNKEFPELCDREENNKLSKEQWEKGCQ